MSDKVELEMQCSRCKSFVYAVVNLELNGNHVITCPVCYAEHFRFVTQGMIIKNMKIEGHAVHNWFPPPTAVSPKRRKRTAERITREMIARGIFGKEVYV